MPVVPHRLRSTDLWTKFTFFLRQTATSTWSAWKIYKVTYLDAISTFKRKLKNVDGDKIWEPLRRLFNFYIFGDSKISIISIDLFGLIQFFLLLDYDTLFTSIFGFLSTLYFSRRSGTRLWIIYKYFTVPIAIFTVENNECFLKTKVNKFIRLINKRAFWTVFTQPLWPNG